MPTVSICLISYNHEKYLRKCLEGFLMQKTSFEIEILIFDDASTDMSQDIILEYELNNSKIRTFLQKENQWGKKKYGLTDWLFPAAKGKYIAICEGDDFWTDPYKLQKQVDFLEANENFSMCYTKAKTIDNQSEVFLDTIPQINQNHTLNLENYLLFNQVLPTASMLFNREYIDMNILNELVKFTSFGDGILTLLAFQNSSKRVCILNEITTVYRVNNSGSMTYSKNMEQYISSWISMLQYAKKHFPTKDQNNAIRTGILFQYGRLSAYYLEKKDFVNGIRTIFSAIPYFSFRKKSLIKDLLYPLKKIF